MLKRVCGAPGEQQSLSEHRSVWWVEGAPQDIGVLVRRVLWGAHEHLGRGEDIPKGAKVLEGPRQKVSRGTQVGDKGLERSLGKTCQSMSPS